ncbi:MAG: hypothetical protein WC683_06165 [bacterium]
MAPGEQAGHVIGHVVAHDGVLGQHLLNARVGQRSNEGVLLALGVPGCANWRWGHHGRSKADRLRVESEQHGA